MTSISRFTPIAVAALVFAATAAGAQDSLKTFEGSAALGVSLTNGNANATTLNATNRLKYVVGEWGVGQDLAFFYGEADNKVNANFWNGGLRGERSLTPRVGLFVATRFDRNVLQGIASRFEEGVGVDIKAIIAPKDNLNFALGVSAFQQTFTSGSVSSSDANYPAARASMNYKHTFTKLAFLQQLAEFLPNLSNTDAYLLNTESALVAPLTRSLAMKFGLLVRYNSLPPIHNDVALKTTDTFFTSGLTYSF